MMRNGHSQYRRHTHRGRGGFTLAEALMASMVLAIVAGYAILPILAGIQQQQEADKLARAVELGQALMDEILARPVVSEHVADKTPGPSAAESSRKLFRNVDAFHNYSESDRIIRDYKGSDMMITDDDGFWRASTVQYVTFPGQQSGYENNLLRVTVTVFHESTQLVTFTRLLSQEGAQ